MTDSNGVVDACMLLSLLNSSSELVRSVRSTTTASPMMRGALCCCVVAVEDVHFWSFSFARLLQLSMSVRFARAR